MEFLHCDGKSKEMNDLFYGNLGYVILNVQANFSQCASRRNLVLLEPLIIVFLDSFVFRHKK